MKRSHSSPPCGSSSQCLQQHQAEKGEGRLGSSGLPGQLSGSTEYQLRPALPPHLSSSMAMLPRLRPCQMGGPMCLHAGHKQPSVFTQSSNASHVSRTTGGEQSLPHKLRPKTRNPRGKSGLQTGTRCLPMPCNYRQRQVLPSAHHV